MDHNTFVGQLKTIPLQREAYYAAGLDDEYIDDVQDRFTPVKRSDVTGDPIVALISGYDVSKVQIGMIGFDKKITQKGAYKVFGHFEVDRLAIDSTGKIVLLEETGDTVTMQCAADSGRFLDAVVHMGKFLEKRSVDDLLFDDEKANRAVAAECASLAGGIQYLDFYTMMTGF